ncbi:hypothetical protein GCM10027454_13590 [Algoriphagus aestuariicola]
MAKGHTLKLNSYSIILRRYNEKREKKSEVTFSEFFESFRESTDKKVTQNTLFNRFYKFYLESFNSEFVKDKDGTKAYTPGDTIEKNTANFIIDGIFEGGLTGIEQSVQDQKRKKLKSKISKDDVAALPFYFLFWLPSDVNYGIIMIQSYGNSTINSLVKDHLKKVFKKKGFTFDEQMCISNKDREEFLEHSVVHELSFLSTFESKNTGGEFSAYLGKAESFQVEVRIKNLHENTNKYFKGIKDIKKGLTDFIKLSIDGAKKIKESDPKAFYKGDNSRSHAVITDHKNFIPSLVLGEELKENGKQTPDLDSMRIYCKNYLKILQKENNYTSQFLIK